MRGKKAYIIDIPEKAALTAKKQLEKRGYRVSAGTVAVLKQLCTDCQSRIVILPIGGEQDYKRLKGLLADFPDHFFCPVLDVTNRDLLFKISQLKELFIIPMPFREEELSAVFSRIEETNEEKAVNKQLCQACIKISLVFEWETRNLPVTKAAHNIVNFIRYAGFDTNSLEDERISLALEEAFVNAIDHGNLELDSDIKGERIRDIDRYEALKAKRLTMAPYAHRTIRCALRVDQKLTRVTIEDQGRGFDTKAVVKRLKTAQTDYLRQSGKGLYFIKRAFDEIAFNAKGNRITMLKRKKRP